MMMGKATILSEAAAAGECTKHFNTAPAQSDIVDLMYPSAEPKTCIVCSVVLGIKCSVCGEFLIVFIG